MQVQQSAKRPPIRPGVLGEQAKDKGQKNAGLPDESFSAPGMSMERYGRLRLPEHTEAPSNKPISKDNVDGRPHIYRKAGGGDQPALRNYQPLRIIRYRIQPFSAELFA